MRSTVAVQVVALTLASISVAGTTNFFLARQQAYPACANTCLINANLYGCPPMNDTCLCNTPAFVRDTSNCINNSCTGQDLANAIELSLELCKEVGVDLAASSSSSSAAAAATATTKPSTSGAAIANGISALVAACAAVGFAALAF